jgi:hypothetical protein
VLKRGRVLAVVIVAAIVAAPFALDACVFSCAAASTHAARLGAPPCHHHAGHHATVDGQNTAQASRRALGTGDWDAVVTAAPVANPAVDRSVPVFAVAPDVGPPPRALTPLRI